MRQQRVLVVLAFLLAGFGLLELRLLKLQFLQREIWARESERSTLAFESLPFERGWILDRNGEPLARTEEVRDVLFRFRDWRCGTVAGQCSTLFWLLDGSRRSVADACDEHGTWLAGIGDVRVADIAAVQPRQRERDVLTYLRWLLGSVHADALHAALSAGAPDPRRLSDLPGWEAGLTAALDRGAADRAALADLARVAGLGGTKLLEGMQAVVDRADERVLKAVGPQSGPSSAFARVRELHADFDGDHVPLASDVSYDCQTLVAVRGRELHGFTVQVERRRVYPAPLADVATTLVGRLGAPSPRDVDDATADRVRLADLSSLQDLSAEELDEYEQLRIRVREIDYGYTDERGSMGLESALEPVLRGKRGWIASAPNTDGETLHVVESAPPQRGLNVTLTLDAGLQRAAEGVLDDVLADGSRGWPGAIVLLDPRTGEVLALASGPRPARARLGSDWAALLADPRGPLCNRAIDAGAGGNLPPPGSTFKPIAALAALTSGRVSPLETFECTAEMTIGGAKLGCLGHHYDIALRDALAVSCNIYFYRLGEHTGPELLLAAADRFGFGRPTGLVQGNEVLASFGIPVEGGVREGAVPLPTGTLSRIETMRLAIGQAALDDCTPLQIASAYGAIGTGELRPPSLIKAVEGYGAMPPREARSIGASAEALAVVREGLAGVVESQHGTARELRLPAGLGRIHVAAKTGTPQVGGGQADHSWLAGYLPREQPRLAFAFLFEHTGQHGGHACVPAFNALFEQPEVQEWVAREVRP